MKPIRQYMAAVVQMDSQNDKGANLKAACRYIDEAAARGARLVCFPEVMNLNGKNVGEGGGRELIPGYTTQILMDKAREHGLYIHSGSLFERIPGDARAYNTSVLIDPAGQIVARYRKLHTFDATLADGTACRESDRIHPGTGIVTVDTALGRMGLSICYEIRFPELYRAMALQGAEVVFTPANFTYSTGKAPLGTPAARPGHRKLLLYPGPRPNRTEGTIPGLRQQHDHRSLGPDPGPGGQRALHPLCPD